MPPELERPAVFVVGLMFQPDFDLDRLLKRLSGRYGPIHFAGDSYRFSDYTDYYEPELGPNLQRRWYVFENLFEREKLKARKLFTNGLEKKFSEADQRRVNVDPGYLTGAKLVLASRKNESHRIYLGQQVFAEVTLKYAHGSWRPFDWTYPDMGDVEQHEWLAPGRKLWLDNTETG